jgi:hypothetical protein
MAHGYMREYDEDWDRGEGRDQDRERGDRQNRDFMIGDPERSWDRDRHSDRNRSSRGSSSHQDDHYRSWRNKQIEALDRDYADYCREREQQFHSDFDSWRTQRRENVQPLRTGMTQTGMSHDPSGELQLTNEESVGATAPDPTSEATLGTNSARGTRSSRGRR